MKPPVLLCFNLQGEKANRIRLLAMRFLIRVRPVSQEEFGQSLAALCGLEPPENPAPAALPFSEEMLVLAHFSSEQISAFLGGFRQAKIPPVSLKAVLTETNASWNPVTLFSQLCEERDALSAANNPKSSL